MPFLSPKSPWFPVLITLSLGFWSPDASGADDAGTKPRYVPAAFRQESAPTPNFGAETTEGLSGSQFESRLMSNTGANYRAHAAASPGTSVGTTWHDIQYNATSGRQVAVWFDTVMVAWTQGLSNSTTNRQVAWNRVLVDDQVQTVVLDDGSSLDILPLGTPLYPNGNAVPGFSTGSGYVSVDILPGSGSTAVFGHLSPTLVWRIDEPMHTGTFFSNLFPTPPPTAAGDPLWPRMAVGLDASGAPDTILHVVAQSSTGGTFNSLWHWRGKLFRAGAFPTVTSWGAGLELDQIGALSYTIATDPNSNRVAVVYCRPVAQTLTGGAAQRTNNVVYWESTNAGVSWTGPTYITNNANVDPPDDGDYAYADVSAVYDDQNNLHVTYSTHPVVASAWDPLEVTLWHWDVSSQTASVVAQAWWTNPCALDGLGAGAWASALAKPSLVYKPAGAGPGAGIADEVLYIVWSQFGPTEDDCTGTGLARTNAEIYYSASSDGGAHWSTPINVTGTQTPACASGNCRSENWVTAAARADSGIYLSYVEDTQPGSAPAGEGGWTVSPYKVLAVATKAPVPSGRLRVKPVDPPIWGDPYWTNRVIDEPLPATGLPVSATIEVCNLGNSPLEYQAQVMPDNFGPFFVKVNGASSVVGSIAPSEPCEPITIDVDPNGFEGLTDFVVKVFTTNGTAARAPQSAAIDTMDLRIRVPGLPIITCPIVLTGDVNVNGSITSADVIGLVNYVFKSGAVPSPCEAAGDINCNGSVTSADVIALVNYVFKSGASPCDACTSTLAAGC